MTIELESMAVEMPEVKGHPNRVAFRGVLTVVDTPSRRPPSGSKGKRVLLTRRAAEKAIPSLLGMAVDYALSLDQHDQQRKVGVITSADIVGSNLEVSGYLYAKDFPEIVEEIGRLGRRPASTRLQASGVRLQASGVQNLGERSKSDALRVTLMAAVKEIRRVIDTSRAKRKNHRAPLVVRGEASPDLRASGNADSGLGMSFEVTNVNVLNKKAAVWRLIDVTFTGAAILKKDKAAYPETWIELS